MNEYIFMHHIIDRILYFLLIFFVLLHAIAFSAKIRELFYSLVTVAHVLHTLSYDVILYSLFDDHYSES